MSVHIHRRKGAGWTQLSNDLLRDPRMSFKARGVLVTLLSHEDGWQQSVAYTLTEATDGRDATRTALVELERLGYVERLRTQSKAGRWVTDIHVYDHPKRAESPASDAPTTDEPTTETPALDVEALDVEPLDEEPQTRSNAATASTEKTPRTIVPDRWPYFLDRLQSEDDAWKKVTIAACVKLSQKTSVDAVGTALSFASVNPPSLTGSAYGWLQATAKGLHEAAA